MNHPVRLLTLVLSLASLITASLCFAEPSAREAFAKEDRPIEGVPVEAFELTDTNLEMRVWARSPLIYSPVAMDCDAQGRLWCTEGINYNRRTTAGGSIIVLEDKDGNGEADSSHVFVTEPKMRHAPLGIAVFDNRIVVSATPDIIIYTDVDRNAVFDPAIDKREVFLTGFKGGGHDHSVHAVVGAPSGQWHFSFGNCGADVKTKDERHIISGSYYGFPEGMNQPSSDGHLYKGGMTLRINPDGTGLEATGENMRNPHDMFVSSFGDMFQSDNDDPAHSRASWVMEFGNMGYADLRDGSRSWEEVAKTWEEPAGWNKSMRFSRSHWRENYPGSCPPGSIYGAGSPTGNLLIEDDTLGLSGRYFVACIVRKEIMGFTPNLVDAQIELGPNEPFIRLKPDQEGQFFLPTDLALGTDGSLFMSDFYNNTSRRTMQVSGSIYRITRKGAKPLTKPTVDFESDAGCISALSNPAVNVRSHAAALLVSKADSNETFGKVKQAYEAAASAEQKARLVWVLAQLGEPGRAVVEPLLSSENDAEDAEETTAESLQITAYRALRLAHPNGLLERAAALATSPSMAVRREVALSLRDVTYSDCKDILDDLITGYDGRNRYYLEALGTASTGKESEVYAELVRPRFDEPATWSRTAKNLAWRLNPPDAIADLDTLIRAQQPPVDEFRLLAMAFASFRDDAERLDRSARLSELALLPAFAGEHYQVTVNEILAKDLNGLKAEALKADYKIPETFGEKTEVSEPNVIAALAGDAVQGKTETGRCLICHKVAGAGVQFGPELTHWGKQRTIEEIITDITKPDAKFAHGYEKPVRLRGNNGKGNVAEGLMSNYSWHAGSLKIKIMGGTTLKVPFRRTGTKIEHLETSWMPSASEMGMTDQQVRDVAEYLKSGIDIKQPVAPADASPGDTKGPGWQTLDGEDFVNVNCHADTWKWVGGRAYCTGKPVGVIRYREPLRDFEFTCEWMHKQYGGNSGVFVWATPASIAKLAGGQGRLPHGIEVQVLDLGYAEVYKKRHKKPADWFTSHGDVFPVGPVKMKPFPPVAPNGRRSFPTKETTKGINEWNHYFVRAIDGEVRLWVNGEEVSGGDQISPASGFLCLESEGAPIEFRNLRLRPIASEKDPVSADIPVFVPPKPVTLKDHPILGTWHYFDTYTREITADGFCTLRNGDELLWKRRCTEKAADRLVFEGGLSHTLKGDTLHIEGRYEAKRSK